MKKLERVPAKLGAALAPNGLAALTPLTLAALTAGRPMEDAHGEGLDASGRTWAVWKARGCVFERVSFSAATIKSVKLRDVRFVACDFSNAALLGCEAKRVEFVPEPPPTAAKKAKK